MSEPTPRPKWADREDKSAAMERTLNDLRQSNRLAIHMNEFYESHHGTLNPYFFSERTWNYLNVPPEQLREKLSQCKIEAEDQALPLISMTLLPAGTNAIQVYNKEPAALDINNYGYLFDLSQKQAHAPIVVGAPDYNMESGRYPIEKKFLRQTRAFFPPAAHNPYSHWMQMCAGTVPLPPNATRADGANLSEQMLDKLGEVYMNPCSQEQKKPHPLNEIIVAASYNHAFAISIVMPNNNDESFNMPLARLVGALVGLQHIQQQPPIDLPVVLYHTHQSKGHITYVGQGAQELKDIALQSVEALQALSPMDDPAFGKLRYAMKQVMGIDLCVPLSAQKANVAELQSGVSGSSPSPRL